MYSVTAVNAAARTVTLDVEGLAMDARYPLSVGNFYTPQVSDKAWCLVERGTMWVIGFDQ